MGQVNGLVTRFREGHSFGRPSRITARVSVGRGQVVNVERDAGRGRRANAVPSRETAGARRTAAQLDTDTSVIVQCPLPPDRVTLVEFAV